MTLMVGVLVGLGALALGLAVGIVVGGISGYKRGVAVQKKRDHEHHLQTVELMEAGASMRTPFPMMSHSAPRKQP